MTERPYRARSAQILDSIYDWQEEQGQTDATMTVAAIECQVLATLESGEQAADELRTANLIAYAALLQTNLAGRQSYSDGFDTTANLFQRVNIEIRDRLGITL